MAEVMVQQYMILNTWRYSSEFQAAAGKSLDIEFYVHVKTLFPVADAYGCFQICFAPLRVKSIRVIAYCLYSDVITTELFKTVAVATRLAKSVSYVNIATVSPS